MTRELNGWARPRPLRVAFLVQDGEHAQLALDGIFADSYNRWGGRFSLIAPCINGQISPGYWPWLEAFDPDIVYSYVPLTRSGVLEIYERLCPAKYISHEIGRESAFDVFDFKPSYDFSPLSSLSIIFRLARNSPAVGQGSPIKIIDSWHTEKPSRFLTDNLGAYHVSRGTSMYPTDAMAAANLLTIVAPEHQDRRFGIPRDLVTIPSEMVAFKEFAERKAISLSLASTLFAPKLDIRSNRWSGSFNLVVGDAFADRILFWNARLLIPNWLDRELCCFRVDLEQLKDPEFAATLGELLNRQNHVNAGSGGQSQLTVRSASLSAADLAEAHKLVSSIKPWSAVRSEPVTGLDDIIPSVGSLKTATENNRFSDGFFRRPNWARFLWSPPTARPPTTAPDHLLDAPPRQLFTEGYWGTDFIFESDDPGPSFSEGNRWMLPRRWRMAGAFNVSFAGDHGFNIPPSARRSRDGNLAIFVCPNHPIEAIKVPTAYEATKHAFVGDGAWAGPGEKRPYPASKVVWFDPSNEARYLTGVLGMTGGLTRASAFLLHPFLEEMFASLGGTPNLPTDKVTPTVNRLRKKSRFEKAFDLRDDVEKQALAGLIAKAARELRSPMDFVRYDELKESWKAYREAYWIAHPQPGETKEDADWNRHEEDSLDACLIEMRQRQIMFQGHRWTCPKCHHRNWVDLALLSTDLACEVCKRATQAPVDIRWLFRPNEFLIESLRDHSVLSLIWTLTALRRRSHRSFMFVEPTWFGLAPESIDPDAEADLLVVLDGEAILCEVKSSWHSLRRSHIEDFVRLATRLRPDTALLAVMDSGPGPESDLAAARAQLDGEGIGFELLTTDTYGREDSSFLYGEIEE